MAKRTLPVILIGILYIVTGAFGMVSHFRDVFWLPLISLVALVAGVFMVLGSMWARWLAIAWMLFHVVLSAFHTLFEFALHAILCVAFAYFLFLYPWPRKS
ncbi:MAG TPA: hypothetical protein VKU01_20025 [Bryobacteraceae bacterium]|nr:hypothetical protein [Bryobacteraceae bacterium]